MRSSHDDVMVYMSAADVLVLPSYSEGLPTVLVEAGSARLPVIASQVGGIPELLAPDRGVLLPDIQPDTIRAALDHFSTHRDQTRAAADRLHDLVVERYDVDRNAARLVELYHDIAPGLRGAKAASGSAA